MKFYVPWADIRHIGLVNNQVQELNLLISFYCFFGKALAIMRWNLKRRTIYAKSFHDPNGLA